MRIKPIWLLALAALASLAAIAYWQAFPHYGPRHHGYVLTLWTVCLSLTYASRVLWRSIWKLIQKPSVPG
jgi:hypothetical protein